MVTWVAIAVTAAVVLTLGAELLHARRVGRLALLVFGPAGRSAWWVRAVPFARAAAAGLLAWGLGTLATVEPKVHLADSVPEDEYRHLVLVLDVSPSMRLEDAGPTRQQSRSERARDVLDSLFGRVAIGRYKITVVATYNGAMPVVIDTLDAEVVRNVLGELPMQYAFQPGRTKLFDGIAEAGRIAADWDPGSALLLVVSDGDTVPPTGMPSLPASIGGVMVIGVGDPLAGSFIDGRQSRQDVSSLRQIAVRLGGIYHDGNQRHVSSEAIRAVTDSGDESVLEQLTEREYALIATAVGAALLALLPLLLQAFGTSWQPGTRVRGARIGRNRADAARSGGVSDARGSDRVLATPASSHSAPAGTLSEETM